MAGGVMIPWFTLMRPNNTTQTGVAGIHLVKQAKVQLTAQGSAADCVAGE